MDILNIDNIQRGLNRDWIIRQFFSQIVLGAISLCFLLERQLLLMLFQITYIKSMILARQIYFQKQGILNHKCGLHALNNLIGHNQFQQAQLNQICEQLKTQYETNYKHFLGGDYDANVLMTALSKHNFSYNWLNNNKRQEYCNNVQLQEKKRVGFIVNRSKKNNFISNMFGFSDRHWIAIRKIDHRFYILDSKQAHNHAQSIIDFPKFLTNEMQKDSHIIQVFQKQKQKLELQLKIE